MSNHSLRFRTETVERYGSIYHRVAGKVENLKRKAVELGQQWV